MAEKNRLHVKDRVVSCVFLANKTLIIINHALFSGVYTDEPRLLSMMSQRRELGDIVCCAT